MKSVTVHRKGGFYGELRILDIFVDGAKVGGLRSGHTLHLDLDDSAALLEGRMDWGQTEPVDLREIDSGQTVIFQGKFTWNFLKSLAILPLPFKIEIQ